MLKDQGNTRTRARDTRILLHFLKTFLLLLCFAGCSLPDQHQQSIEQSQVDGGVFGHACKAVFSTPMLNFGTQLLNCEGQTRDVVVSFRHCSSTIKVQKVVLSTSDKIRFRLVEPTHFPLTSNPEMNIKLALRAKVLVATSHTSELTLVTNQGQWSLPLRVVGKDANTIHDRFFQRKRPQQDIVFVIENSSQMGANLKNLNKNIRAYIRWATHLNVNYRIGVVPADLSGKTPDPACIRKPWIHNRTKNPLSTLERLAHLGTGGADLQQPLEAMKRATLAGCNQGFFRRNALLNIVFLSSTPDYSPQTTRQYVHYFRSFKGFRNLAMLRANAVVGPPASGCRVPAYGTALPAPRLWEVAKQLHGVQTSFCSSNWSSSLSAIGSLLWGPPTTFFLSHQPEPASIQVLVNRKLLKNSTRNGWVYDNKSNALRLYPGANSDYGVTIDAYYKKAACQLP